MSSRLLLRLCSSPSTTYLRTIIKHQSSRNFARTSLKYYCTSEAPLASPVSDNEEKVYPENIKKIVNDISGLTLLEVSDLNELLKKTLNIKDAPMMAMAAAAPAAAEPDEEEESASKKVQTSFTLKLMKFDDSKKVALIKELKSQLEGMNLVQSKKFVESVPQIVKADISKDEAEKLKSTFEAVGGTCEIS